MVAVHREMRQLLQRLFVDAVRQVGDGSGGPFGGGHGLLARVIERAAAGDGGKDGVEMLFVTLFDAAAYQLTLLGVPFSIR
jgi:hypothetical protein